VKPKTIITAVVIIALVALAFLFARSCGLGEKYKKLKADYLEAAKVAEADHEIMTNHIGELTNAIGQKDEEIAELKQKEAQYVEKTSTYRSEIARLRADEPVQPELEVEPLVINLREQIGFLNKLVESNLEIIANKDAQIRAWEVKFNAQADISQSWKEAYEREHNLRVQAEGLFKVAEHKAKANSLKSKVATAAVVVAGVVIVSQLVHK
jgi:hypothetical protein